MSDPLTASDAKVAEYADTYYEYDSQNRATKSVVQGGLLTYTYAYDESEFDDAVDHWKRKTTMTRPDESQVITYSNYLEQPLLVETVSGSDSWIEYRRYDENSTQEVLHAHPSAVSGYDDSSADLSVALKPSAGLIEWKEYYASTTATATTAGGAKDRLKAQGVKKGASSTPIKLSETTYFQRTARNRSIYPVAQSTVYRDEAGAQLQKEFYARQTTFGKSVTDAIKAERAKLPPKPKSNAYKTNVKVTGTGRIMCNAGRGIAVVGVAIELGNIAAAPANERVAAIKDAGARFAGAWAGAEVGGALCAWGGPWGVAICSFLGGVAGAILGEEAIDAVRRGGGGGGGQIPRFPLIICFTEDTLVSASKGRTRISQISQGDLVWSFDVRSQQWNLRRVIKPERTSYSGPRACGQNASFL